MLYEEHKYLPPKFAHGLGALAKEVGVGRGARIGEVRNEGESKERSEEKIRSSAVSQKNTQKAK